MLQHIFSIFAETDEEHITTQKYDVAIIGGGPAGLSAGLYTARAKLDTVLIEKDPLGCNLCLIKRIDNYPGFPDGISGRELTDLMVSQATKFGVQVEAGSVIDVVNDPDFKLVKTDTRNFQAKAIIITTGISKKRQSVDGEEKFQGRGVSYCATCDGPFFKGTSVAIVGGGDEALEEAIFITRFAEHVTIIHSQEELSANEELQKMAYEITGGKIEPNWGENIVALIEYRDGTIIDVVRDVVPKYYDDAIFVDKKNNTDLERREN